MAETTPGKWPGYRADRDVMPLGGYAVLVVAYNAALAAFLAWAGTARPKRLPRRIRAPDLLLLGVATHKLTRVVGKDFVTAPVRAPFVQFEGSSIAGEVAEKSRGHGLRRAVGDLLSCEYCLAPWVAGGLFGAFVVAPRATRFYAGIFAAVAVSDFLNRAYTAAAKKTEALGKPPPIPRPEPLRA